MNVREIGYEEINWTALTRDHVQCQVLVLRH